MIVILALGIAGCNGGEGGSAGGGAGASRTSVASVVPTEYCWELSGNGVTFSADIHGYTMRNFGGSQQNPNPYNNFTLTATTQTYCLPNSPSATESFIASFTLNSGAGVLTINTKKNGVILRTDTLSSNGASTSINDAN